MRVIRDLSEIASIRDVWEKWQKHPNADIDHYITVLEALNKEASPLILVLYRDSVPLAMLVGRRELRCFSVKFGYWELFPRALRHLVFITGGYMGELSPENITLLIRAAYDCLKQGEAKVAYFSGVMVDSPLFSAATKFQNILVRDHAPQIQPHHTITLPRSMDEFIAKRSSKFRRNLMAEKRKLESAFAETVEIRTFHQRQQLDDMFAAVEEIAMTTYQRGLRVGFADTQLTRRRLSLQADTGLLRAYVLYLRGTAAAFLIATKYQKTMFLDYMGYKFEMRQYSPGTYLLRRVIGDLCDDPEHGTEGLDFGSGDAQYKSTLGDHQYQETFMYLFAPTVPGVALNFCRTAVATVDGTLKKILDRTNLLQRIKRQWRNWIIQRGGAGAS